MSEHELPEDPRQWPESPFELLGVPPGIDPAEIRRAYTRLIRRFKPEHHPEQFRRIREAYEVCLGQNNWYFPQPEIPATELTPYQAVWPDETRPQVESEEVEGEEGAAERSDDGVFDRSFALWAAAEEGRDTEAYAGLGRLADEEPDNTVVPLQLYWLLAVSPELDSSRSRHDWLAQALSRANLEGAAAELYRRELDSDPAAGRGGPYLRLLELVEAPGHVQLAVANWRVQAASRCRSWNSIDADVQALARHIPYQNEAGWLAYLVDVLDWVGWERPQPVYSRCLEELEQLRHLELGQSHAFDRIEAMEQLAAGWRQAADAGAAWDFLDLLPHAWAAYGGLSPEVVTPVVDRIAASPVKSLRQLDDLATGPGRSILRTLYRVLADYRRARGPHDEPKFPPKRIRGLFARVVASSLAPYAQMRDEVLRFLIGEAVHPAELARACAGYPEPGVREISDAIYHDLSLRVVWQPTDSGGRAGEPTDLAQDSCRSRETEIRVRDPASH